MFGIERGRMMPRMRPESPVDRSEVCPVEMIIGLALVVVAALLIVFIVRTVQANMPRA